MAIQIPNPGTGNGATGDNEFVLWSKVKDNFEDQSNAASRLVGTASGQIPLAQDALKSALGRSPTTYPLSSPAADLNIDNLEGGDVRAVWRPTAVGAPPQLTNNYISVLTMRIGSVANGNSRFQFAWGQNTTGFVWRTSNYLGEWDAWEKPYTDKNTTLDGNGALKPSSPVLRVFSDCITGNEDGDAMAATYTKNGVGDYTISGTTGLRTDGWYVVIPNDMNGNPKVAITLDDTDGDITLKTYVRIFDMSTFKFVPDLEQPLDIPEGRWIDLRFNDLPFEAQEELPTDGG